ncbi:MAG: TolC family protein [Pyrinomonadaceae bacterium]|nr:TolC family protein [Pyrinomonadaceae bacterium]
MFSKNNLASKDSFLKSEFFSCLLPALAVVIFISTVSAFSQDQPILAPVQPTVKLGSAEFIGQDGLTIDRLIETGASRRGDLLAARQRLAIAQGRLQQAGLRPNPTLDTEYGSPRFLGGEAESEFSVGATQVFELGGKRKQRVAVAELELQQARFEVAALERQFASGIRTAYARAVSAARQLDVIEKLLAADAELVRVTEARLKEGDVAPLDANLVRVESDRLRVQQIEARSQLEIALLEIRTLAGLDVTEPLRLAPQTERPPRLDLGLSELTAIALRERADLQAALIGERLGMARINLAKSQATPNVAGSVRYSRNKQIIDFPPAIGGNTINRDNELTFGVSIDIPIFNRNQGEIAQASSGQVQAVRQREFLEAIIKRDVAVAYWEYRAAAEKLVLYATQILPRSEANLQTVRSAYGLGEFSVFEVVNEQRRLNENVTGYNQTLRDYYTALAQLEAALGIAIPPTAFSDDSSSVLPEKEIVPQQIEKEKFLKSFYEKKPESADVKNAVTPKNKRNQEKK